MVNEETLLLLRHLKQSEGPVSGVALARQLGVSRVALWKRFEALRAAGYPVEADRTGYRLRDSDKPLPWEFPGDEAKTFHFETLSSTMDEAMRLGFEGLTEGAVVAERQSAGRGRQDRPWESAGGDLLVTLVVRPALPLSFVGALGLEALAALAETLDALYHIEVALKWPNDLVAGDRKVAGVLVEAFGAADRPQFYTVGLGLNVHSLPDLDRPVASVEALGGRAVDRRAILAGWRRRVGAWCAAPVPVPARWSARSPQKFDRTGSLLLDHEGTTVPLRYGETRIPGVTP